MYDYIQRSRGAMATICLGVWLAAGTPAGATCGSASCFLITQTADGLPAAGSLLVDISFRYVDQSRKLSGTDSTGEVLTPRINFEDETIEPDHHREIRTLNSLAQVDLTYGIGGRWGLVGSLPLMNQKQHEHFDDVGDPAEEHFTNDDGTTGIGDLRVGARVAFVLRGRSLLLGGLDVKLPTGPYRLLDGEGAINEPTIQPGTGSIDLHASLLYDYLWSSLRLEGFAFGAYRANGENGLDYRVGDETQLTAGVRYRPGARATWSLQVNARHAGRDLYRTEAVDSTGSLQVNLTPGVSFQTGERLSLYGHLQMPIYQDVNEAQLAPRYGFVVGLTRTFGTTRAAG